MNKWHLFFSGILHLLLHSQVLGAESCGNFFARHMIESNAESANFELFMQEMIDISNNKYAGTADNTFSKWIHYLMYKKNIGEMKNISQLRKDIVNFPRFSNANRSKTKDELSQILNVDFLQEKENDAPRTALCFHIQYFTFHETTYYFPGLGHVFVLEKGGKNEFRLWQSWVQHFSALEWLKGKITNETEPRDTTYTHGNQPLSRHEAEQLVKDLIMYSDSNLDWNKREPLSAKLFWANPNIFLDNHDEWRYFDSNRKVSNNPSCDKEYGDAMSTFRNDINNYFSNPENLKAVEERRRSHKDYCADKTLIDWFLNCDRNVYSKNLELIQEKQKKCYTNFSKTIDLSKIPNLPKVQISLFCHVKSNPNNGEQCAQNMRDMHRIMAENP